MMDFRDQEREREFDRERIEREDKKRGRRDARAEKRERKKTTGNQKKSTTVDYSGPRVRSIDENSEMVVYRMALCK